MIEYDAQKALLVDAPPTGKRWIHELKLDGFRMGLIIRGRAVQIFSRRGTEYTAAYPEIVAAARKLKVRDALIDGEVVVVDERGLSSFERLQRVGSDRTGLSFFAFDLLWLNGKDLRRMPLVDRKARLNDLLRDAPPILQFSAHFDDDGAAVFAKACELGAEGIVSKLRDGPYQSGVRSSDWRKSKCIKRQELVVGGFTDPDGSRVGIGSLLVGYYERGDLRFAGKVGNGPGWNDAFGRRLRTRLEKMEIDESPFTPRPPGWLGRNAHWVEPRLVAEVAFSEWTSGGNVRHPSLQGFRDDKRPREVVRERPSTPPADPRPKAARVYPRAGLSRDDLAKLYRDIADWVLPHVEGRPLTLVRARGPITREDALRSQATFVHHTARDQAFVPESVPRIRIAEKRKTGEYLYVDSIDALIAIIEAGVVEWHVWNARVPKVEWPNQVVFDLDPGDDVEWPAVVAAARRLRAVLAERDLDSWVKTTGGKGLHVVAPFRPEHDWDSVFEFTRDVATQLAEEDPSRYLVAFARAERRGKVLIDYKRNYRTSIAVAGFSLRARPDASMSIPVRWEELGRIRSAQWNAGNVTERLRRLKVDPWKDFWSTRQRLAL